MGEQSKLKHHNSWSRWTYSLTTCSAIMQNIEHKGTFTGWEFGWGGTSVKSHRRCPKTISIRTEILCRLKGERIVLFTRLQAEWIVKAWPIDPFGRRSCTEGCLKTYHRDNWFVAAKRSQRRCFLILRCRLFLSWSCRRLQVLDCSPIKRDRELGSDRRETG